ncbi:hypothetical protein BDQ17DRAFT_1545443 [Cyathus striatus]|nr:hypothetical protein BDQ17DRAFT_1545443 [Cyathus striatus]
MSTPLGFCRVPLPTTMSSNDRPAATRAQQAPAHRCPTEILIYIFLLLIHDPRSFRIKPFHLTSVCQRWASIVGDTPSLWTRIRVRALHQDEENEDLVRSIIGDKSDEETNSDDFEDVKVNEVALVKAFTVEMITKWLSRTGSLPLDIYIEIKEGIVHDAFDSDICAEWTNNKCTNILSDVFRPFLPYAGRWRSLHLPMHKETLFPLMDIICSGNPPLPLLTSLVLQSINSHISTLPALRSISSLRSLKISHPRITHPLPGLLQWNNLTRFVCSIPIKVECVKVVLTKCSSAVDMAFESVSIYPKDRDEFYDEFYDGMHYIPFKSVEQGERYLPKLQNLVICMQEPVQYSNDSLNALLPIFQDLNTPSLHTLVVEEQFNPLVSFKVLEEFIKRSNCNLKKLTLNGIREYDSNMYDPTGHSVQDLISLITTLTSLEELSLHISKGSKLHKLWTTLCSAPEILPRMKTFQYTGPFHFTVSNLVEMLQCRWYGYNASTARLERAVLKRTDYNYWNKSIVWPGVDCTSDAEVIADIRELITEGMVVSIAGYWEENDVFGFRDRYEFDVYVDNLSDVDDVHGYVSRGIDPYWTE